ncbi:GGDEF domain-containing protein [Motilimonas sp. E26]|uniref:GGDEF domain-containing protein n=2 Tax=Alteromonadales genera incertae sedis TaxID=256005 RepID=UPI001E379CA6|nr:GGDEF domain-containing protein [Motilimonas sp. E26]MDO6524700.1 GGDEF domain-containing protein [Motilimonas sp. 1_MG-2023]
MMKNLSRSLSFTSAAKRDLIIISICSLPLLITLLTLDISETMVTFFQQYEHFELDELMPLGMFLSLCFTWFSWRRWREIKGLYLVVEKLSLQDPITLSHNRRAAIIELSKLQKSKAPFGLILVDLDNFKQINESFGYDIGDEVLVKKAQLLQRYCGKHQFSARWAGAQFIVIAHGYDVHQTQQLAKKLHRAVVDELFNSMEIVCRLGLTQNHPNDSVEQALQRAQDALLEAKLRDEDIYQQW